MPYEFAFSKDSRQTISSFVSGRLAGANPYHGGREHAVALARLILEELRQTGTKAAQGLLALILASHRSDAGDIPAVVIRGCFDEPVEALVPPAPVRGFDYATNPADRMKTGFTAEWCSWGMALLFNCESVIHPCEHGGGNRFHMVSPLSADDARMKRVGASTAGGRFHLHNDVAVFTDVSNRLALDDRLRRLGTNIETVGNRLGMNGRTVAEQILCGSRYYPRVDVTMLAGVVNETTPTCIGTPAVLHDHLMRAGYAQAELDVLSAMPVAHMAGPADGKAEGFVGRIAPPLHLDVRGRIVSVWLNLDESRMRYVGPDDGEARLFERFVADARHMPCEEVLIESGDILLFPNLPFDGQTNVLHGRAALREEDYRIEVAAGKYMRRVHCRQYLVSNRRTGRPSAIDL